MLELSIISWIGILARDVPIIHLEIVMILLKCNLLINQHLLINKGQQICSHRGIY